jgi:hypothetical protein
MASALTFSAQFDHEGGGSRLFRNVKNTAHSQTGQKNQNRIDTPLQITNSLIAFFLDLLSLEDGMDRLP